MLWTSAIPLLCSSARWKAPHRLQAEEAAHQRAKASLKAFLLKNEENKATKAAAAQRAKQEDLRLLTLNEQVEAVRDAVRQASKR